MIAVLDIIPLAMLDDNYGYLLCDPSSDATWVVDPSEAEPVLNWLAKHHRKLTAVVNTHHHWDHVGGNLTLKQRTGCRVFGPLADAHRIPGYDEGWGDGDRGNFAGFEFQVLSIPGHTSGHIALDFPSTGKAGPGTGAVFTGDTLFLLGCGRLFEGTPEQMAHSLARLAGLPDATRIYCGHEYTLANLEFAKAVIPTLGLPPGPALALVERGRNLAAFSGVSVPGTIGEEKATNPFLLALDGPDPVSSFAALRRQKDHFSR